MTPNWSIKAEYLYYDLGSTTANIAGLVPGSGGGGTGYNTRFENDGHIVRAGLNYKFGSGPLMARYRYLPTIRTGAKKPRHCPGLFCAGRLESPHPPIIASA